MNSSLISVIVPVYNVEIYLRRCVDSILTQSYQNLEIILIDDGSTDFSGRICDEYAQKDKRIVVVHKQNGGVSSARNFGIEKSRGEYICFIDSDDIVEPDMIEIMLQPMLRKDVDLSCCLLDVVEIDGFHRNLSKGRCGFFSNEEVIEQFFTNQFIKDQMYGPYNKLFKASLLKNIRFKQFRLGEDILFVFETLLHCRKIFVGEKIGYHYMHRENSAMTSVFSKKRLDYIYAAEEIVSLCKKKSPYVVDEASKWLFFHYLITMRTITRLNKKAEYLDFYQKGLCYLKENRYMLTQFNFIRKLDYWSILYFPTYLKMLNFFRH